MVTCLFYCGDGQKSRNWEIFSVLGLKIVINNAGSEMSRLNSLQTFVSSFFIFMKVCENIIITLYFVSYTLTCIH